MKNNSKKLSKILGQKVLTTTDPDIFSGSYDKTLEN